MIKFLTGKEIETVYPVLYEKVFGVWNEKQLPSVVIVDENITRFISGYWQDKDTFYIQYSGVLPEYQNGNSVEYLKEGIRFLVNNLGAKAYTAVVPNTYTHVMKILINCKFIPHGMRVDVGGQLYLEWIRLEVDNG